MARPHVSRHAVTMLGALALVASIVGCGDGGDARPRTTPAPSASTSAPPSPSQPPSPIVVSDELPGLVGTVGDSLTAAVNVNRQTFGPAPRHSWVVGTDPDDVVVSHLERLRALGADPVIADAAQAGATIADGDRQAREVTQIANALPNGAFAYVTFELGANDLCARRLSSTLSPSKYEREASRALAVLAEGLPPGSVVLVLSVPDVPRLSELFGDLPRARAIYDGYGACASALAEGADLEAARDRIGEYNAILARLCDDLPDSPVRCIHDQADPSRSLFGAPFTAEDVSDLDYFHPSLAGQARISEETWRLTPWS